MTIEDVLKAGEQVINRILKKELIDQGHHLEGRLEESFSATLTKKQNSDIMEGFALHYVQWVNKGFPASSASFKQVPFLIDYWRKRGLNEKEAVGAAFATIKVWQSQGMPTQASKRFSSTGSRTDMIENSFVGHQAEIDQFFLDGFDQVIDEEYHLEKSETI